MSKWLFGFVSKDRKVQKSLSFRVFATIGTFAVAWVFTGNPFISLPIAGAQAVTNTSIYWLHENYWEKQDLKQVMKEVKRKEDAKLHKEFIKHFEG